MLSMVVQESIYGKALGRLKNLGSMLCKLLAKKPSIDDERMTITARTIHSEIFILLTFNSIL